MKNLMMISALLTLGVFVSNAQSNTQDVIKPVNQNPPVVAVPAQQTQPAPEVPVNPNAADFKFETETFDFGTITEGIQATHEFEFINTGKEPLIISNVRASCGCTTPSWTKEPVAPGAKGNIKAIYNSAGRPGNFSKAITVTSNSKTPTKVLYIKGNVEKQDQGGTPEKKPSMLNEQPK